MKRILSILLTFILLYQAKAMEPSACANELSDSIAFVETQVIDGNVFKTVIYRLKTANWPKIIVSFTSSSIIEYGVDYLLKENVNEWRPNYSDDKSFPSRHSSSAFSMACTASYFLIPYSPWWGIGMHTLANGMGFQRVMSKNHYPGDVMAGAGVGLGANFMGTVISNWIFGPDPYYKYWRKNQNIFRVSLTETTGTIFPLTEYFGEYKLGTALTSTLRGIIPIGDNWGATTNFTLSSAPIKQHNRFLQPLNSMSLSVGAAWHHCFSNSPFAVSAFCEGGYKYNLKPTGIDVLQHSYILQATTNATIMLTDKFAVGAEAGYSLTKLEIGSMRHTLSGISVGFLTRANF